MVILTGRDHFWTNAVYIHFDTAIYTMDGEIGGNTLHNKTVNAQHTQ